MVDTQGRPKRLMAISAHPDDMEFGCGGTIGKWIREGWEGALVIATDGRAGHCRPGYEAGGPCKDSRVGGAGGGQGARYRGRDVPGVPGRGAG